MLQPERRKSATFSCNYYLMHANLPQNVRELRYSTGVPKAKRGSVYETITLSCHIGHDPVGLQRSQAPANLLRTAQELRSGPLREFSKPDE
jgi:hypothetical protein